MLSTDHSAPFFGDVSLDLLFCTVAGYRVRCGTQERSPSSIWRAVNGAQTRPTTTGRPGTWRTHMVGEGWLVDTTALSLCHFTAVRCTCVNVRTYEPLATHPLVVHEPAARQLFRQQLPSLCRPHTHSLAGSKEPRSLKECIRSLYQEADHTPFRGSKLTQVCALAPPPTCPPDCFTAARYSEYNVRLLAHAESA